MLLAYIVHRGAALGSPVQKRSGILAGDWQLFSNIRGSEPVE